MAEDDVVAEFRKVVFAIIQQAADYAGQAEVNEDVSAAIRQIQTLSAALSAALMQIRIIQQPSPMAVPMPAPMQANPKGEL